MIVVTGATGTIGRKLLRLLADQGAQVKALSRNPPDAETRPGITWVAADLANREALPGILAGAERLFLLTGNNEDMVRLQKNAIAAAQETGVAHVVKLSALGASDHSKSVIGVWHYNVERALQAAGLAWTILRPHVFMQNLLEQRGSIQQEGRIYSPAGEAQIPMIDTRDIAAVAAAVLTEPGHERKRYTLTGPAAVSYREATAVLASVLGRPLTYVPETYDQAWHRLREAGLPPWHIGAQLALASYQRQGAGTGILTDTVEAITGRPPRTFQDFARDQADAFRED
jgi:uncharacterized protein YbjT (DUF2867 family)